MQQMAFIDLTWGGGDVVFVGESILTLCIEILGRECLL